MVMVIDGDVDEVDGEYVKWLLKMLHWWYAAVIKDLMELNLHEQSQSVTIVWIPSN